MFKIKTKKDIKIENLRMNFKRALKQNRNLQDKIYERDRAFEKQVKINRDLKEKLRALKKEVNKQLDRNDYGAINQKFDKIKEIIQDF